MELEDFYFFKTGQNQRICIWVKFLLVLHIDLHFFFLFKSLIRLSSHNLSLSFLTPLFLFHCSIKSSNWISPLRTLTHHRPNSKSTQTLKVQKSTIPPPKFKIYPNPQSVETNFLQCSYLSLSIFLFFFRSQVETTKNNLRF